MTPNPRGNDPDTVTAHDAGPLGRGPTRRQALVLAGGSAVAVGAAVGPFSHLWTAGAADGDEADTTTPEASLALWLVGLELGAAELYDSVRESGAFDDASRDLAATCAAHHTAQAAALGTLVSAAGAEAPSEANPKFISEYKPGLDGAASGAEKAEQLYTIENSFAATYQASFETLTSGPFAALAAKILATDAAQAVAWSAAANGQGSDDPQPSDDAIPESQTESGAFDQAALTPTPTTTTTTTTGDEES